MSKWRLGRRVPEHIYVQVGDKPSDDDVPIYTAHTREHAAQLVLAHNAVNGAEALAHELTEKLVMERYEAERARAQLAEDNAQLRRELETANANVEAVLQSYARVSEENVQLRVQPLPRWLLIRAALRRIRP